MFAKSQACCEKLAHAQEEGEGRSGDGHGDGEPLCSLVTGGLQIGSHSFWCIVVDMCEPCVKGYDGATQVQWTVFNVVALWSTKPRYVYTWWFFFPSLLVCSFLLLALFLTFDNLSFYPFPAPLAFAALFLSLQGVWLEVGRFHIRPYKPHVLKRHS